MSQVVSTTTLRSNLSDSLDEVAASAKYLLVSRGKQITAALVNIDLFEDLLALSNKKYLHSIEKAREEVKRGEVFSHDDVFGDLS